MRDRDGLARDAYSHARQRPCYHTQQHHREDEADQREPAHEGSRSHDRHPARADRCAVGRPRSAAGRASELQSNPANSAPNRCRSKPRRRRHGYEIQFFVSNVEEGPDAQTELFDLVFRHCASAGIRLAPPSGSPAPLAPRVARPDAADMPRRLLDHLPIFAPLSEEERIQLAPR